MVDSDNERWHLMIDQLKEVGADTGEALIHDPLKKRLIVWLEGSDFYFYIDFKYYAKPKYCMLRRKHNTTVEFDKHFDDISQKYKEVLVFYLDLFDNENAMPIH